MRQDRPILANARRRSAVALAVITLVTAAAGVRGQAAPSAGGKVDRAQLKQLGEELAKRYAVLEQSSRALPRDRFDPHAVIERVGRDPAALAAWVRDETDPLPYRGALRGAPGVLMDRAGNSLDRALLLAELLRGVGHNVRLANATLPPDAALAVVKRSATRRHATAPPATQPALIEARRQVERHASLLLKSLGHTTAPQADASSEGLADHWWVQRQDGNAWIDHDLVLADFKAPAPARTIPFVAAGSGKLPLEPKDCHEVDLSVVIEIWADGKLKTERVLTRTFRPAEVLDRDISLTHFAGSALSDVTLYHRDEASRKLLLQAMAAQRSWMPVLRIGNATATEASFTTGGEIDRNPRVDPRGQLGGGAAKTLGGLGGALGGDSGDDRSSAKDVLTAQWIDYVVRVPGEQPYTVRREVFDLVGPAARKAVLKQAPAFNDEQKLIRAARLLGRTDILIQPCNIAGEFLDAQLARRALGERHVWLTLTKGDFRTTSDVLRLLDRARADVGGDAPLQFALLRVALAAEAGRTFIDRPNIVQHTVWVEPQAGGSGMSLHRRIDLALTSTAVAPAAPDAAGAFAARVTQGVADTMAEQLVLGADGARNAPPGNTAAVFAAASERAPLVARAASDLAAAKLTPDTTARAAADLAAGNVLVLASLDSGRCGWWRVDPRTGQTVGVMDNGFHSADTEYDVLQAEVDAQTMGVPWRVTPQEFAAMDAGQVMSVSGRTTMTLADWFQIRILQTRIIIALGL